MFAQLSCLEELWLQRNAISHLPGSVFSALPNLTFLSLQGNVLQTRLPLLRHSPGLVSLSLSHNQLETVPKAAFANLTSLRFLTLLAINALHPSASQCVQGGLEGLVKLYLSSNNSMVLHPTLFQNLSKLELLSLSRIS